MIYVGIDSGFTGALCFINDGDVSFHDMPTIKRAKTKTKKAKTVIDAVRLVAILNSEIQNKDYSINIEKVGSMPNQGVTSTFNFGEGYGMIQGVLVGMGLGYNLVTPQVWKKKFNLIGSQKDYARTCAIEQYPKLYESLKLKKHSGRADAFFIALSGKPV